MARFIRRERVAVVFERLPAQLAEALAVRLERQVERIVGVLKRRAPVGSELEKHPGQLRDSVHAFPTKGRPLSWTIIADARDDKGHLIGLHIEVGHLARDGSHVPGAHFFYPTWRAEKPAVRADLRRAVREVVAANAVRT